jgi:hypothetical protein
VSLPDNKRARRSGIGLPRLPTLKPPDAASPPRAGIEPPGAGRALRLSDRYRCAERDGPARAERPLLRDVTDGGEEIAPHSRGSDATHVPDFLSVARTQLRLRDETPPRAAGQAATAEEEGVCRAGRCAGACRAAAPALEVDPEVRVGRRNECPIPKRPRAAGKARLLHPHLLGARRLPRCG